MKKFFNILTILFILSLAACGTKDNPQPSNHTATVTPIATIPTLIGAWKSVSQRIVNTTTAGVTSDNTESLVGRGFVVTYATSVFSETMNGTATWTGTYTLTGNTLTETIPPTATSPGDGTRVWEITELTLTKLVKTQRIIYTDRTATIVREFAR